MTLLKKCLLTFALSFALTSAATLGYQRYKFNQEGKPYLVGRCFGAGSSALIVSKAEEAEDESGKSKLQYFAILVAMTPLGPFPMPQVLDIRETNASLKKALAEGVAEELDCETGEPLGAK